MRKCVALAAALVVFAPAFSFAAQTCVDLTRTITLGSSGSDVAALQTFLAVNAGYTGKVGGIVGQLTVAAIQRWQSSHGIVSSGAPTTTGYGATGPRTRAAMGCVKNVVAPATLSTISTDKTSTIASLQAQLKQLTQLLASILAARSATSPVATVTTTTPVGSSPPAVTTYTPPSPSPAQTSPPSTPPPPVTTNTTPASCTFNGQSVASGASVTAYQSVSVAYGSPCVSETRVCTNGALSGSATYAQCTVAVAPPPPPPPTAGALITPYVGVLENTKTSVDWDEFASSDVQPTYTFGTSGLSDIRAWVGVSDCAGCGGLKTQRFRLANLDPGDTYTLVIKPAHVSSAASFYARVSAGTASISRGASASFSPGYQDPSSLWTIRFTPQTSDVTIEVGGNSTSGANYLYFDAILTDIFKSQAYIGTFAQTAINNLGPDLNSVVQDGNATYSSYYLDAFVTLYEKTKDVSWLKQLVPYADAQLAQRDSVTGKRDYRGRLAPAWQEKSGYVWVGTTGEVFEPMVRFAADVQADASLQSQTVNGQTLEHAAQVYVTAFQDAITYHHEDWHLFDANNGTFYYANDIPVAGGDALAGQPVAQNLTAAFMSALLYLSQFDAARNYPTEAAAYRDQVRQFANYLQSQVLTVQGSGSDAYYLWHYSTYYPQIDDIGHSNFVTLFMYRAYKAGIVFGQSDMQKLANTYNNFLGGDGNVRGDLIDTSTLAGLSHSIFYWHLVAPFRDDMLGKDLLALHIAHPYYLPLDTISIATR